MLQTPAELEGIKVAGKIAERALIEGARGLKPGLTEVEAAELFRKPLSSSLADFPKIERADGFTCCMSGPNSAEAYRAYARSRARRLQIRDLVLVHCNSCADGWTDITRTYSLGPLDNRKRSIYQAVYTAREPAFAAVKAGKAAVEVDQAASVGFSAINVNARPRLHPRSPDVRWLRRHSPL